MTMLPLSALDRYSEFVLTNGYVPQWEVHTERIRPVPQASPEALAAAYCEQSPTERHVWWVEGATETCRWCGTMRPVVQPAREAYNHSTPAPGRPPSLCNLSMKAQLLNMAVGSVVVIEHRHLQCLFYESGGQKRCGLLRAISRLRIECGHTKEWQVKHREAFVGIVRRIA